MHSAVQCASQHCTAQCTPEPTSYKTARSLLSPGSESGLYKDFPGRKAHREPPRAQHLKIAIGGGKKKSTELTTNQVTVFLTLHFT